MANENPNNRERADSSALLIPPHLATALADYRKYAFEKAISIASYIKMLNHPTQESALHSVEKQLSVSTASLAELVKTIEVIFQQSTANEQHHEFLASAATDNLVIETLLKNALEKHQQQYQQIIAQQNTQLATFKQAAKDMHNDATTPLRQKIANYIEQQITLLNPCIRAITALLVQLQENLPAQEKNIAAQLQEFESAVEDDNLAIGMQLRSINVILKKLTQSSKDTNDNTDSLIEAYEALFLEDKSPPESPRRLRSALSELASPLPTDQKDNASQAMSDAIDKAVDEKSPETSAPLAMSIDESAITYLDTKEFLPNYTDAESDDIVNYNSNSDFDELDLNSIVQLYLNLSHNDEQIFSVKSQANETNVSHRPETPARKILKIDSVMALANFVAALKNPAAHPLIATNRTVLDLEYVMQGLQLEERARAIELICTLLKQKHGVQELLLAHNHFTANELQTLTDAFLKAKAPTTSLQLIDLKHSVESKDPNALNQLIPLRRAFESLLRLDPLTERHLKLHESNQLKNASIKYMKHIRNAILPAFKQSGHSHAYSINLTEPELMKKIVADALTKKTSSAASEMHNNKFATRIKKYHYLLEMLNAVNNHPNDPVRAFYKKYEEIKPHFPKNTAPEDKASELEFYRSIKEKVALQRIEKVGFFHHDIKRTARPTTAAAAAKKPRPPSSGY